MLLQSEDDGIVLFLALRSGDPAYVSLVCLDAATMQEIGRAEAKTASTASNPLCVFFVEA